MAQPRILALVLLCCLTRAALVRHPPALASARAALGGAAARAPPVALTAPEVSPFEEGSAGADTVGRTMELTLENVDAVLEDYPECAPSRPAPPSRPHARLHGHSRDPKSRHTCAECVCSPTLLPIAD